MSFVSRTIVGSFLSVLCMFPHEKYVTVDSNDTDVTVDIGPGFSWVDFHPAALKCLALLVSALSRRHSPCLMTHSPSAFLFPCPCCECCIKFIMLPKEKLPVVHSLCDCGFHSCHLMRCCCCRRGRVGGLSTATMSPGPGASA